MGRGRRVAGERFFASANRRFDAVLSVLGERECKLGSSGEWGAGSVQLGGGGTRYFPAMLLAGNAEGKKRSVVV